MKKILIASIILTALIFTNETKAQVRVGVNINIGSQPAWGPVGYDHVDYYYLPDIGMYYYVPTHEYIYLRGNRWIHTTVIPTPYAGFDFYHSYKVVINGVQNPWLHAADYRVKYAQFKGRKVENHIYNNHDVKYQHYYSGNKRTQPAPPVREHADNHGHEHH